MVLTERVCNCPLSTPAATAWLMVNCCSTPDRVTNTVAAFQLATVLGSVGSKGYPMRLKPLLGLLDDRLLSRRKMYRKYVLLALSGCRLASKLVALATMIC